MASIADGESGASVRAKLNVLLSGADFPISLNGSDTVNLAATSFPGQPAVPDFKGDGSAPMDDNFAAAVACALASGRNTITVPASAPNIRLDETAFLGDVSNPDFAAYSLALVGLGPPGNNESKCSGLNFTFDDDVGLALGVGQRQYVSNLRIKSSTSALHPLLRPTNGCAVGIPGGGAGASDTVLKNLWIHGFYAGVVTSYNGVDAQGEKVDLENVMIQAAIDLHVAKLQNRGVAARNCRFIGVTNIKSWSSPTLVDSYHGGSGQYSYATLAVNNVSAAMTTPTNPYFLHHYKFAEPTAALEVTMTVTTSLSALEAAMLAAGGYQAMGLVTTPYGCVPMCPVSYDSGTKVLVARVWPYWLWQHFSDDSSPLTVSDLGTYLSNATVLHVSTWGAIAIGNGIHLSGGHTESVYSLMTAMAKTDSGGGGNNSTFENFNFGYSISQQDAGGAPAALQPLFPFFLHNSDGLLAIKNLSQGDTSTMPVTFDHTAGEDARFTFEGGEAWRSKINERIIRSPNLGTTNPGINYQATVSRAFGGIEFDRKVHGPIIRSNYSGWQRLGWARSRYFGCRPELAAIPQIAPSLITYASGTEIHTRIVPFGERLYQLSEPQLTGVAYAFVKWAHVGITHGLDFDGAGGNNFRIGFTARGGSPFIILDDDASGGNILKIAEPGWVLKLNNGTTDHLYMCTGINPATLTISVCYLNDAANTGFVGTAGVQYTGNVKQQPFVPEYFGEKFVP